MKALFVLCLLALGGCGEKVEPIHDHYSHSDPDTLHGVFEWPDTAYYNPETDTILVNL